MKKKLHPRRTLRRLHRVLCLTLMVLSLTTMLIPFAAAADLDGGLSSRGTIGNITDTTSAADPDTGLSGGTSANLTDTTSAVEVIPDGDYLVALKNDKTKGWNIGFASTQIDKATMIVDNLGDRELHERFRVVNHGGGMISIHPLHALDLSLNALYGAACRYGSTVTLHNFEPNDLASYWMPIKNADGSFTLKNAACSYVIELASNKYTIGNSFRLYPRSLTKSSQTFWFIPVSSPTGVVIPDGDYQIGLYNDKTRGFNIGFASTQIDKASLILDNLDNRELHEIFRVVNHGGGLITIHPLHALNLCLNSMYGAACRRGSNITLHNFEEGDMASYWRPIKNTDGSITLKNAASGYVIDLSGNNYSIGNRFINYSNTGNKSNQAYWFMPVTSEQAKIQARLNQLMDGSYGNNTYKTGTTYTGPYSSQQCKGFARTVHSILFGYDIGSTKNKPNNYQININSATTALVGSLTELSKKSDSTVRNLLAAARPGDFIQVRRSHGGSHSMIFLSSDANGVKVYECNVDGRNGIRTATISWSQFRSSNAAVSVYTARDYRLH